MYPLPEVTKTCPFVVGYLSIKNHAKYKEFKKLNKELILNIETFEEKCCKLDFNNKISQYNIQTNFREINRRINEFDLDTIEFLYTRCEVLQVILDDISEAFQFFDSQNARGQDLEPHDLLKAYHLREMINIEEDKKKETITVWENTDTSDLARLFSNYIFRIRSWCKFKSARVFTKNDIDLFKGISLGMDSYPYAKPYEIVHFYIKEYMSDYHRNIDNQKMIYPFQLDQPIINGQRFFEMINFYKKKIYDVTKNVENEIIYDQRIIKLLNTYEGKNRTGDQYVRNLFDCALIYYIDRFSFNNIDKIIEKFFIWAYSLRLKQYAVQVASIDNYAMGNIQLFRLIRESNSAREIMNINLEVINKVESSKTDEIKKEFIKLGYFHE